jgi:plastocyanin
VLLYGLSTGHKVGLGVVGAVFILFALASSLLFPRFRPQYPGRGLPAFIIVAFVFLFGMLTAVEVFGAEPKETKESERAAQTEPQAPTTNTTVSTPATSSTQATSTATTTPSTAKPQTIQVSETEFKITLAVGSLHAGLVTFQIKNTGKIPHDLAIVGGPKSKLIPPGGSGTLRATLKSGKLELYCSVPGHKQAGMDVKTTVSASAATTTPQATTAAKPKPQTVQVTETEFKITLATSSLHAGPVTFQIKNTGKIAHDLAMVGGPKSKLIPAGGTATLKATLKPGTVELYCSVPGHKQAGMDLKHKVS